MRYYAHIDDCDWGYLLCSTRCGRRAELLYDGAPMCIDCADELLERTIAIERNPKMRSILPPLQWSER